MTILQWPVHARTRAAAEDVFVSDMPTVRDTSARADPVYGADTDPTGAHRRLKCLCAVASAAGQEAGYRRGWNRGMHWGVAAGIVAGGAGALLVVWFVRATAVALGMSR